MRKLAIALLAGAGALFTGSANAADVYTSNEYANAELVQQVRLICDESGRCYRTQGGRRVIVEDSYNYAPRERYIERRGYRDWGGSWLQSSRRQCRRRRRQRSLVMRWTADKGNWNGARGERAPFRHEPVRILIAGVGSFVTSEAEPA